MSEESKQGRDYDVPDPPEDGKVNAKTVFGMYAQEIRELASATPGHGLTPRALEVYKNNCYRAAEALEANDRLVLSNVAAFPPSDDKPTEAQLDSTMAVLSKAGKDVVLAFFLTVGAAEMLASVIRSLWA